jgi:hypothetical protein
MGSRPFFFLQFVILCISLTLSGQDMFPDHPVTLSGKSRTINQVLDEFTLQTGYYFTFDAALIPGEEKVRFQVSGLPLKNALDSLLRDSTIEYRVIRRNIVMFRKNETTPLPVEPGIGRYILKGRVVDDPSGKPLAYATIALSGTSLGSITNEEGDFSFKVPENIFNPVLVVSYMGYRNKVVPVSYPSGDNLTIRLEKEVIPLQEVIIRYADPVSLVREALAKIPDNYLQDPSAMTAFYRESVRRNDRCMSYTEAVLDVAKGPYSPSLQADYARIRKGRKITDHSARDTVMIKLRSGVYSSLTLDIIKNPPDFLSGDFQELYDMDFSDMMTYGDRLVYVISFRQKERIPVLMFQGKLYLDQESLAIIAADFEYNPELIQTEPELFMVSSSPHIHIKPILARYHIDYRELQGRYSLSQVRAEVEMKVRKRRRWMGALYRITLEMAVTDVNPGERLKINMSERVKPGTVMADQPFEFDPLFWGPYNTIQPEATLMESLRRLEQYLNKPGE